MEDLRKSGGAAVPLRIGAAEPLRILGLRVYVSEVLSGRVGNAFILSQSQLDQYRRYVDSQVKPVERLDAGEPCVCCENPAGEPRRADTEAYLAKEAVKIAIQMFNEATLFGTSVRFFSKVKS